MKNILVFLLCVILLAGCQSATKTEKDPGAFAKGVWITYSEVDAMLKDGDYSNRFSNVLENCKTKGITDIFLAVKPFYSTLYKSKIFPRNEYAKQYDHDLLEYSITKAHKSGIRLHAWVNPYRVSSLSEIDALPDESPVKAMSPGKDYIITNGIYLNPSSTEAIKLITEAVREICKDFKVDGIHFDDYFYPTTDESFDKETYGEYSKSTENALSLAEYRKASVNALISSVYTAVKFTSKSIIFSVSPCASSETNANEYYADLQAWCENGCVDLIIPQLYFGFEYPDENYRFDALLNAWKDLLKETKTDIWIGLASYKKNTDIPPDNEEWKDGEEIITRQTNICRDDDRIKGVAFFSYSYLFS